MTTIAGSISFRRDVSAQWHTIEKMVCAARENEQGQHTHISTHAVISVLGQKEARNSRAFAALDGRIDNAEYLIAELGLAEKTGYKEIIERACEKWGLAAAEHLDGPLAFCYFDGDTLILGRDRFGLKSIYYSFKDGNLIFASRVKSMLLHPDIERKVDISGWNELISLGPGKTPGRTVFSDIHELAPGHLLCFKGGDLSVKKYWSLESREHDDPIDLTIKKVRELLESSIDRQTSRFESYGAMLSGGLDSSILTADAASKMRKSKRSIKTFSVNYEGNDEFFQSSLFTPDSDAHFIEIMRDEYDCEHRNIVINAEELLSSLKAAMIARDRPAMADVDGSLLLFLQRIGENEKTVLSGEGADEIFGGYPWYIREELCRTDRFPWAGTRLRQEIIKRDVWEDLKAEDYANERLQELLAQVPKLKDEDELAAKRRQISYLNLNCFGAGLLERTDRMSSMAGVEVLMPFCDTELLEYVWNIPAEIKLLNGREKGLLREAFKGILPEEVRMRKKSPYPKTHNPDYFNAVSREINVLLDEPSSPIMSIIDAGAVKAQIANYDPSNQLPWYGQLMTVPQMLAYLLQMNQWMLDYSVRF